MHPERRKMREKCGYLAVLFYYQLISPFCRRFQATLSHRTESDQVTLHLLLHFHQGAHMAAVSKVNQTTVTHLTTYVSAAGLRGLLQGFMCHLQYLYSPERLWVWAVNRNMTWSWLWTKHRTSLQNIWCCIVNMKGWLCRGRPLLSDSSNNRTDASLHRGSPLVFIPLQITLKEFLLRCSRKTSHL